MLAERGLVMRLEGRRPVAGALKAGRVLRLYLAEGAHGLDELLEDADKRRIEIERVPRARLDAWSLTGKHQGVIADVRAKDATDWRGHVEEVRVGGGVPLVVAVDGVQDPRNLGAIARSAAAFGADLVLIPTHRSAPVTETTGKAAAGALEVLPIVEVSSLQAAIEHAREDGLWVIALDEEAEQRIEDCVLFAEPCVVVIGAEARGVSRTLRKHADALVRIDTDPGFPTLNASVAAGIALFAANLRRRPELPERP